MERSPYIKPSVLQLEFRTDEEVVSMGTCKSTTSSNQQTSPIFPIPGSSCSVSQCSSLSPS